jgi:hypothetical protein
VRYWIFGRVSHANMAALRGQTYAAQSALTVLPIWNAARDNVWSDAGGISHAYWAAYKRWQPEEAESYAADLLRCCVGNLWRPPAPLTHTIRGWQDSLVPRLAGPIWCDLQEHEKHDNLPVLAHALEEAGWQDPPPHTAS